MKAQWINYAMAAIVLCVINSHSVMSMESKSDDSSKVVRKLPPLKSIGEATPRPETKYYQKENSSSSSNALFALEAFVAQYTANQPVESH